MALSFTQIKEQFLDAEDNPLTGTAEFTVNVPLYATGVPVMLPGVPVQAQIINGQLVNDSGGTLELADLASTGLVIEGSQTGFWFYTVAITVAGQVLPPWSFFLEHSATPIDLFSLANTPAGGGSAISSVFGRTGTVVAASGDYSVGQVTGAAPLASPAFTGTPTAPTASALTGDTQVATTAYADAAVAVEKSRAQTAEGILATAVTTETDRAETAEGLLIPLAQKGAASGVASLDSGTHIPAAQLPAATTSVQGAVIIDGTAGDIQPSPGTQAAGSVGKPSDAGHVHGQPPALAPTGLPGATAASRYVGGTISGPSQTGTFAVGDMAVDQAGAVWVCFAAGSPGTWKQAGDEPCDFRPEAYGAKGDVAWLSDAAISSGQHDLTSPSNRFAGAVQGQIVYVAGAGAGGADFQSTIATVVSAGHVTTTAAAGTTVSGKGCVFHTNDAPAIKAMYAAGHAYALASPGLRARFRLSKLYGVADAPTVGGATLGNAIIPLTVVPASASPKIRLEWAGDAADAAELPHWLQPAPQFTGPGLVCTRLDGTNDATYGPASVIGGPVDGYGAATSTFSNMSVVLSNFRILVPFNSTYSGADFLGLAEDCESGFAGQAMGIAPSGGAWPQLNQAAITNQYTFACRSGDVNNNDRQDMSQVSAEGWCYGFMRSEHTTWDTARTIYCIIGLELYAGSAGPHGIGGGKLSAEACAWAVGVYGAAPFGNTVKAVIGQVDMEIPGQQLLYDTANLYIGSIGALGNYTPGYGIITVNGGHGARICDLMQPAGPIGSPQVPAGSGSMWVNEYYSDLWVTLDTSGGTISALTLYGPQGSGSGVAQPLPASATLVSFFLPAGCGYKATFTGTFGHYLTAKGGN